MIPAESVFATALARDPAISVGPAPRVIRFAPGAIHPDVFGAGDVDDLLAGGMYLARKFDVETEPAALDRLDEARLAAR